MERATDLHLPRHRPAQAEFSSVKIRVVFEYCLDIWLTVYTHVITLKASGFSGPVDLSGTRYSAERKLQSRGLPPALYCTGHAVALSSNGGRIRCAGEHRSHELSYGRGLPPAAFLLPGAGKGSRRHPEPEEYLCTLRASCDEPPLAVACGHSQILLSLASALAASFVFWAARRSPASTIATATAAT